MHDGAGRRLHFRGGFAHRDPGDAFDLLPQQVDGALEELSVKLLHLNGALGVRARAFSAGDSASCSVTTSVSSLRTTVTALGAIASPLLLEDADRLGDLLRHGWIELLSWDYSLASCRCVG